MSLDSFLRSLESGSNRTNLQVVVLDIQRYLVDLDFKGWTGETPDATFPYAYDLTLTDGKTKAKCTLSIAANPLVYQKTITTNSTIEIREVRGYFQDRYIGGPLIPILTQIDALETPPIVDVPANVRYWSKARDSELENDIPLVPGRRHYLPLWNTTDPPPRPRDDDEVIISSTPTRDQLEKISTNRSSLGDAVAQLGRLAWLNTSSLVVVGRIVAKSRLCFYGKATDRSFALPYVFHVYVEDESGVVLPVYFWENACVRYFRSVRVGMVIAVETFRLKRTTSKRPQFASSLATVDAEISVGDKTTILCLDNKALSFLRLRLPPIEQRFVDLDILYHVPDNVVLDVVGLVVYAGRPVRMRKVPGTKTPGFYTMRWVALRDSSSTRVTMLELYACSDPQAWEAVAPGRILVCTKVRVKSLVSNSKGSPARLVYLTTTENSQVYVASLSRGAGKRGFYAGVNAFVRAVDWSVENGPSGCLKHACSLGHYAFPVSRKSADVIERLNDTLTGIEDLRDMISRFHYQETRTLFVQGTIVRLQLIQCSFEGTPKEDEEHGCLDDDDGLIINKWTLRIPSEEKSPTPEPEESPNRSSNENVSTQLSEEETTVKEIIDSIVSVISGEDSEKESAEAVDPQQKPRDTGPGLFWNVYSVSNSRIELPSVNSCHVDSTVFMDSFPKIDGDPIFPSHCWIVTVVDLNKTATFDLLYVAKPRDLEPWMSCRYDVDVTSEIVDLLQMEITPGNHVVDIFNRVVSKEPRLFSIDAYSSEGGRVDLFLEAAYAV